jgi:hypothetical protein
MPGYLAVPVKDARMRPAGWRVYSLPMGGNAVARYRGPFAGFRAQARARKLSRAGR